MQRKVLWASIQRKEVRPVSRRLKKAIESLTRPTSTQKRICLVVASWWMKEAVRRRFSLFFSLFGGGVVERDFE